MLSECHQYNSGFFFFLCSNVTGKGGIAYQYPKLVADIVLEPTPYAFACLTCRKPITDIEIVGKK